MHPNQRVVSVCYVFVVELRSVPCGDVHEVSGRSFKCQNNLPSQQHCFPTFKELAIKLKKIKININNTFDLQMLINLNFWGALNECSRSYADNP